MFDTGHRNQMRPRRYVRSAQLMALRPLLRYSELREAYVLRAVGRRFGPVLRRDRRHDRAEWHGRDRRRGD